jgi:hypothetical protein
MELAWGASWGCGLSLITVTTAIHAVGIVMIFHVLQRSGLLSRRRERHIRHQMVLSVTIIAVVGLLLVVLHGIEAGLWAVVYLGLGAIDTERDAILYSLDSFTTRGATGLNLGSHWQLMGALESANGMLLFGISTAFIFAVMLRIMTTIESLERSDK